MKSKAFTPSEAFLLVMMLLTAVIVLFALAGIDAIHIIGNVIRWLGWAGG